MLSKIINKFRKKPKIDSVDEIMEAIKNLQLPEVKRIYPILVSSQIVGFQPMQTPITASCTGGVYNPSFRTDNTYGGLFVPNQGTCILIKDVLNNMEKIESVIWTYNG